jgi:CHASE3 domain sensor protein
MNTVSPVSQVNLAAPSGQADDDQAVQDGITSFAVHLAKTLRDDANDTDQKIEQMHQDLLKQS